MKTISMANLSKLLGILLFQANYEQKYTIELTMKLD